MQTAVTASSPLSYSAAQRLALPTVFAVSGLLMSSWASRIPALRDGLQISHSLLSFVLLCGGLGAILSYPLASHMMANFGGRKTAFFAGLGLCAVLPAIGSAPTVPLLMFAVLMLGVTGGCFGVGLNSVAARHEAAIGKSRMSTLHALGCAGSLGGAFLGSYVAGMGIKPSAHFIAVALPAALLFCLSYCLLDAEDSGEIIEKKKFSLPRGPLALLGVLGFCGAMSENSIADWSGVFLKDHFGATEGVAPLGLTVFTAMMLISRLAGDRLKEKHGASRLLSLGGGISATGLFLAVFAPHTYLALAGFAIAGLGLSLLGPFISSAAGREGPMATASVGTVANVGALMGPPLMGGMAELLGMQVVIGFIALLSIAIATVSARASILK